jgi:hypothetical protein
VKEIEDTDGKMFIGRVIIKMSIFPKAVCRFTATYIKIQRHFHRNRKIIILKMIWNHQRSQVPNVIVRRNKDGGITPPN